MIQETGIVTKVEDDIAFVRKPQSKKCENCSGKGSCMVLEHADEVVIRINNTLDAHPGDKVSLKVGQQSSGLKRLSLFFIAIFALVVGGTAGRICTPFITDAAGQFLPAISGLVTMIIAIILWQSYYKQQEQPQPIMEKIIRSESQDKHGNQINLQ